MSSEKPGETTKQYNFKDLIRSEFEKKNFGLSHHNPAIFGEPQVGGTWLIYILYRMILMLYVVVVLLHTAINHGSIRFLIYFTNWSYITLACSLTMQTVTSVYHYVKKYKQMKTGHTGNLYNSTPLIMKGTWILYNIAAGSAIVTTVVYWSVLYKNGLSVGFGNANVHAANSAIVIVDHFITGIPVRLLHIYQGMIWGITYTLFTVVFWAAKGTNGNGDPYIYPILNWHGAPGLAAATLAVLIFAGVPLLQLVMWILYLVRTSLYRLCKKKQKKYDLQHEMEVQGISGKI